MGGLRIVRNSRKDGLKAKELIRVQLGLHRGYESDIRNYIIRSYDQSIRTGLIEHVLQKADVRKRSLLIRKT